MYLLLMKIAVQCSVNAQIPHICEFFSMKDSSRNLPAARLQLSQLVSGSGDIIKISDAERILGMERNDAAKALSRWTQQGWLRRVGRGAYAAASLDSLASEHVLSDPWVLVPTLFGPAYVGGRSAAEHWDLTEQIFNDIVVMTSATVRERLQKRHGATFTLKHVAEKRIFGTKTLWRGQTKVAISDVHRTIVDMLDDPEIGGGIQQVTDCFIAYLARSDRNDDKVIEYGDRLGNGAVFKRLGFLAERHGAGQLLIAASAERLTQGNAKLDPTLKCARLISRWRLWVPEIWAVRTKQ